MGLEQRVRANKKSARNAFYRQQRYYGNLPGITNWRMLIARKFKIPISRVREILAEDS